MPSPPATFRGQGFWNGSLRAGTRSAVDLSSRPYGGTVAVLCRRRLRMAVNGPTSTSTACCIFTAPVRAADLRPRRDPDVDGLWHGVPRVWPVRGASAPGGLSLHWKLTVSTLLCGRFTGRRCTEAEGESRSGAASTPARRAAAWGVSIGAVTAEIGPSPASRRSVDAKTPGVADRPASMNHVVHDLGQHPGGGVLAARLLNSPAFSVPMLGRRASGHCSRRQRWSARPARRR
jgi:hypothetical protein